ncbi:MAG: hypothetical protein H0V08_00190 [Thermoleophilaceae bacterium]|nr:hypothetical protein [Thermoleophilaceae bacterium]
MPVLAAALADVLVLDAHPLVRLGVEHHRLDAGAVSLLDVSAIRQRAAVFLQALGEVVSDLLELLEGEDARAAVRAHLPLEAGARVGRAEQRGEL